MECLVLNVEVTTARGVCKKHLLVFIMYLSTDGLSIRLLEIVTL
jgi:hypothetical protein